MRKGAKVGIAVVAGLIGLAAVVLVLSSRNGPRTEFSMNSKLLSGLKPVSVTERNIFATGTDAGPLRLLVEEYELPQDFETAIKTLDRDLSGKTLVLLWQSPGGDDTFYRSLSSQMLYETVQLGFKALGPHRTKLTVQAQPRTTLFDRFSAWIDRLR